jgi:hypothetical protein
METLTEPTGLNVEVWLSFVSMLRSYAAAASLHRPEVHVASIENSVSLAANDVRLTMQFDPASGHITWQKSAAGQNPIAGHFELLPEGAIAIDGITKDLDHVAIDFIASITEQAKGAAQ